MKKFKCLSLLLTILLLINVLPIPAHALMYPEVASPYAVVMDADTGDFLYEKDADSTFNPYDSAVIMTALLVMEAVDSGSITLDDVVVASDTFSNELYGGTYVAPAIYAGESLTVEELLYMALMTFAGDACNILAEYVSGSVSAFVSRMNSRAAELGCTGTVFDDTHGAGDGQYSTARDLAVIARALASHGSVMRMCNEYQHTIDATDMSGARELTSYNALFDTGSGYYYEEATGLRIGGTADNGYILIATASSDNMNLVVVNAGQYDSGQRFADGITLITWAFGNYSYRPLLSDTQTIDTLEIEMGDPNSLGVRPESSVSILLPNDMELDNVQYAITYDHEQSGETLQAPISAGQILGTVTVTMDGKEYGTSRLLAASAVDISRTEYLRTQLDQLKQAPAIRQIVLILVILLAIYLLLVLIYLIQRARHLHSLRVAKKDRAISQTQQAIEWLDIPGQNDPDDVYTDDYDEDYDYNAR